MSDSICQRFLVVNILKFANTWCGCPQLTGMSNNKNVRSCQMRIKDEISYYSGFFLFK